MPDLQTELSKIAQAWDTHEQNIRSPQPQQEKVMTFKTTGNATRDIFAMVQQNQHKYTPKDMLGVLEPYGHGAKTVSSLIAQMKRAGLIFAGTGGQLFTTFDEFVSLHRLAKPAAKKRIVKKSEKAGLTALVPDTMTVSAVSTVAPQPAIVWTADNVLKNIGVAEAAKLYAELGKLFGGK